MWIVFKIIVCISWKHSVTGAWKLVWDEFVGAKFGVWKWRFVDKTNWSRNMQKEHKYKNAFNWINQEGNFIGWGNVIDFMECGHQIVVRLKKKRYWHVVIKMCSFHMLVLGPLWCCTFFSWVLELTDKHCFIYFHKSLSYTWKQPRFIYFRKDVSCMM